MRFGVVNALFSGCSTLTGAFSSVTRFELTFAGYGPYCASLNSNLLYWTIIVPPFFTYSSSRALFARRSARRSYARTPVTMTLKRDRLPQARSSGPSISTVAPSCSIAAGTSSPTPIT